MPAELAVLRSAAEDAIIARFPDIKLREAHWGGPFIARLRDEAFRTLKANGLPNRRVEEWKYTDLRALMRELPERAENPAAQTVQAAEKQSPSLAVADATRILFVNGECFATLKEDGFDFGGLREGGDEIVATAAEAVSRKRDYADNVAVALNTAFMSDCIVLRVPAGMQLAPPLHLEFRDTGDKPFATYPRVLLVLEKGASATLIETHDGPDGVAYQTTALIEVEIGDGASLEHVRHNAAGDKALALSTFGVRLGQDASISSLSMTTGAAVSRHQVFATFAGPGGKASIRGATLLRGRQHSDSTLVINHAIGHGESRELFKSALDGESRGVFQGKIIVAPGAQKTDGKMAAHALLLSEDAEADSKPELEIFADDVVCGHGSTVGALDEDLLFYLKARGIPHKEAEALMVQAFVGEAVEPVENEAVREGLMAAIEMWLKARS